MQNSIQPHPGQLLRSQIQSTVDRKDVARYDMQYRTRDSKSEQSVFYLSDNDHLSIDAFIDVAPPNRGSFWLFVTYENGTQDMHQIISDTTGEPL